MGFRAVGSSEVILAVIGSVLRQTGLDPSCLNLEITESVAIADEGKALDILSQLEALSIRLSIDDFGWVFAVELPVSLPRRCREN
jgi:EAL domain-containing protein (putative c-di-GMP-specific phosphodiesterase class I)